MGYEAPESGVWFYEPGDPDGPMHLVLNRLAQSLHDLTYRFDDRILRAYRDAIVQVLADDTTVKDAAAAAVKDAAVLAAIAWDKTKTPLAADANVGQLPAGVHRIGNGATATALGLPIPDVSALQVVAMSTTPGNYSALLQQAGYDGKGGVSYARAWRGPTGAVGPWRSLGSFEARILDAGTSGARLGAGIFGVLHDRAIGTMPKGVSGALVEGVVGDAAWTQLLQSWTTAGGADLLVRSCSTTLSQTWQRPESPRAVEFGRLEAALQRAALGELRVDGSVPSSAWSAPAATVPMRVPTPDGTGQATHPSIVDVPAGWNGHRYWLGYTPYAFADTALEDPIVAWSDNGTTWTAAGGAYPLDDAPGGADFNSDINLVLHNGTMYAFWRRSDSTGTRIYMRSSTNGSTWTARVVAWDPGGVSAFSPSIVKTPTGWRLWFVGGAAGARKLAYVDTTAALPTSGWGTTSYATTPLPAGREPWHVEVYLVGTRWWGVLTDTTSGQNGVACEVRLMQSADGITWDVSPTQLVPRLGHSHDVLYKATATVTGDPLRPSIALWYSGLGADASWWLFRAGTVQLHEPASPARLPRAAQLYTGHLDALYTPGVYRADYSSQQTAALGYPLGANASAVVEVRDWYVTAQSVVQIVTYENAANGVYERRSLNGAWGSWTKRPTRAEVDAAVARVTALEYTTGWRSIPVPTDAGSLLDGTGEIHIRRRGIKADEDVVELRLVNVGVKAGATAGAYLTAAWTAIPSQFGTFYSERARYTIGSVNGSNEYSIGVQQGGRLVLGRTGSVPGTGSAAMQGTITYSAAGARPSTLPGVASTGGL